LRNKLNRKGRKGDEKTASRTRTPVRPLRRSAPLGVECFAFEPLKVSCHEPKLIGRKTYYYNI
jgi:hypothetical protein